MGLDMYLTERHYIGSKYEHRKVKLHIDLEMDGEPYPIDEKNVDYIECGVGQWRKANHIHKWFVDNVQEGEDDCEKYDVSQEDLQTLFELCIVIMQDQTKASELLPTQQGFFFGNEEYGEYYFQDIEETINIIKPLIEDGYKGDLVYQSSW